MALRISMARAPLGGAIDGQEYGVNKARCDSACIRRRFPENGQCAATAAQAPPLETYPLNKVILMFALSAATMLASAQQGPDRKTIIDVFVNGQGQVSVSEEEAETYENEGALVWQVQDGYRFADDGIVIVNSGGKHDCKPIANQRRFRCGKRGHDVGARYKYMVNVIDIQTQQRLPTLDPYIVNR
jgi:hypothetical protein